MEWSLRNRAGGDGGLWSIVKPKASNKKVPAPGLRMGLGLFVLSGLSWLALGLQPAPSYAQRFSLHFPARAQPRSLARLATVAAFDEHYLDLPPEALDNSEGELAWKTSYRMAGLNEMYRVTGDKKYLLLNMKWALKVMEFRDDVIGRRRANQEIGPVWSSTVFGLKGRAAHPVHTAMITYPILDLLLLDGARSPEARELVTQSLESLRAHDGQWRDGPRQGEGHYVYSLEQGAELAGKPLPINRNNAMAKSLWLAWKLSGQKEYRDRALALGRFFKRRLSITETGAYTWSYEAPLAPAATTRSSEDSSHGALTASLALLLEADGEIFDRRDLQRFAATVVNGVTVAGSGIISGDIEGSERAAPEWVDFPARWLEFSPYHLAIYPRIAEFYQRYDANTSPDMASLAIALLIRFRPDP